MTDDQVADALAEIRERREVIFADPAGRDRPHLILAIKAAREDVPRLLAALDAVLASHPLTATVRYCSEPCPVHEFGGVMARRDCPDCVKVEYRDGCRECRDECGIPVRPEDCRARKAVLAALTGRESSGEPE